MKLNLLPTYVTKKSQAGLFIVLAALLLLLSIAGAIGLVLIGRDAQAKALAAADANRVQYSQAVAYSAAADSVILQATDADRHIKLARAMQEHNTKYTQLYNTVFQYVPSFMRVRSISATPNGPTGATVTLTGTLYSFQQYADAVMALLRIPNVQNVVRSGYTINDRSVPGLNELDSIGTPIRPSESNLPSEPQARMAELIARANAEPDPYTFQNVNNFGTPETDRGALPDSSEVTFVITIDGVQLQTPDPRATIMSGAAGGGAAAAPAMTVPGAAMGRGGVAPGPSTAASGAPARDDDEER